MEFRKIWEYITDNVWASVVGIYLLVIFFAVVIFNVCSIPNNINHLNEMNASREELILTKKHNLVDIIYTTAGNLCENRETGEFDSRCLSEVVTQVEASVEKIK